MMVLILLLKLFPLFLIFGFFANNHHQPKARNPRPPVEKPAPAVPGPLPVLGLGAALVYSRRIKARIAITQAK